MLIADLSLTITPYTSLYAVPVPDANIVASESTDQGRNAIVLDFNSGAGIIARDLGTAFSWPTKARTVLDVWQPSIVSQPETIYGRSSDWNDGGYTGEKFIQGYEIEADSGNVPKLAALQSSEDLSQSPLLEMPWQFDGQSTKTFSCAPFIAHSVRLVSSDGTPWRVFREKLIFQPFPSSCLNWQTEMLSFGGVGWQHVREMNIAHISTADLTLTLTFDTGQVMTLTVPNSGGNQAKTKVTLQPNKFKLMSLQITSTSSFRLFHDDIELKLKGWGSDGGYTVLKPFGGKTNQGAAA